MLWVTLGRLITLPPVQSSRGEVRVRVRVRLSSNKSKKATRYPSPYSDCLAWVERTRLCTKK